MQFKLALATFGLIAVVTVNGVPRRLPELPRPVVEIANPGQASKSLDRSEIISSSTVTVKAGVDYIFDSPQYPYHYPSNSFKTGYLTVPSGMNITMTFPQFHLQGRDHYGRCRDAFELVLGSNNYVFCGQELNQRILTIGAVPFSYTIVIQFWSNFCNNFFPGFSSIIEGNPFQDLTTTTTTTAATTTATTTTATTTTATTTAAATTTTAATTTAVSSTPNDATTTSATSTTSTRNCDCGEKGSNRIVNGVEAEVGEYPWQIALVKDGFVICGGTIIDKCYVLTAAHCTDGYQASNFEVLIGDHDLTTTSDNVPGDLIQVEQLIQHENYNPTTVDNDYALLKLSSCVDFNRTDVAPACLPQSNSQEKVGQIATVSGWGATSSGGDSSSVLLEVDVDIISNDECNQYYGNTNAPITENKLCAFTEGKDACQGDSGGPLVSQAADGRYELIGVVSYGVGCGETHPGVYADVYHVLPWIEDKLQNGEDLICVKPSGETAVGR